MTDDTHDWWNDALALEARGELREAERTITEAVPDIGAALQVAELYRLRMVRLLHQADRDNARDAFGKAVGWANFFASQATSGGEGAALSLQRDQFLRDLRRNFPA